MFVTGTDTEVGKTFVSCALIRQLAASGLRVAAMKPVASGARSVGGQLRNDDALQLMAASNVDAPYEWVNPYCFEPAIAPHIAAQQAGIEMSQEPVLEAYQRLSERAEVVVVEGVGGWAVPMNTRQTMADLAARLNLPVVLVVGMRLGCINHALLSIEAIRSHGLPVRGWIANTLDPDMPCLQENIKTLENFISASHLGVMPYVKTPEILQNINFKIANYT